MSHRLFLQWITPAGSNTFPSHSLKPDSSQCSSGSGNLRPRGSTRDKCGLERGRGSICLSKALLPRTGPFSPIAFALCEDVCEFPNDKQLLILPHWGALGTRRRGSRVCPTLRGQDTVAVPVSSPAEFSAGKAEAVVQDPLIQMNYSSFITSTLT